MDSSQLKKIDIYVVVWCIAITLASLSIAGMPIFIGALTGSAIAFINWVSFRYLAERMSMSRKKERVYILFGLKTVLVLTVVAIAILVFSVDGLGLLIGISSLVLGIVTYCGRQALGNSEIALKG